MPAAVARSAADGGSWGELAPRVCLCCALGRRTSALSLQPTWDYLLPAACCLRRSKWTWRSYDVPEGGTASYCSSDPLSRNNCVQGYSG